MPIADEILLAAALFHTGIKITFHPPWELGLRSYSLSVMKSGLFFIGAGGQDE